MLDLVPNHTSDRHPWFARPARVLRVGDRCRTTGADLQRRSRLEVRRARRRYYLHQFAPQQPDLDWWNPDVRAEFEQILRFWFDRGVGGIRIDVAHSLIKDRQLRDPQERYAATSPRCTRSTGAGSRSRRSTTRSRS